MDYNGQYIVVTPELIQQVRQNIKSQWKGLTPQEMGKYREALNIPLMDLLAILGILSRK